MKPKRISAKRLNQLAMAAEAQGVDSGLTLHIMPDELLSLVRLAQAGLAKIKTDKASETPR